MNRGVNVTGWSQLENDHAGSKAASDYLLAMTCLRRMPARPSPNPLSAAGQHHPPHTRLKETLTDD